MVEDVVAAGNVIDEEAGPLERSDHLARLERREPAVMCARA
jgi:hypothetical protein